MLMKIEFLYVFDLALSLCKNSVTQLVTVMMFKFSKVVYTLLSGWSSQLTAWEEGNFFSKKSQKLIRIAKNKKRKVRDYWILYDNWRKRAHRQLFCRALLPKFTHISRRTWRRRRLRWASRRTFCRRRLRGEARPPLQCWPSPRPEMHNRSHMPNVNAMAMHMHSFFVCFCFEKLA